MSRLYVTTAIPYVNAEPHLGHALDWCRPTLLPATGGAAAGRCGH
jgi:hypothetical protein